MIIEAAPAAKSKQQMERTVSITPFVIDRRAAPAIDHAIETGGGTRHVARVPARPTRRGYAQEPTNAQGPSSYAHDAPDT
jgi:hypothetical protein